MSIEDESQYTTPSHEHGATLSQQELTDLILEQTNISALKLITLSYDMPSVAGNATKIHRHLLNLAQQGVSITVGVDNTYARRVAPKSDLPIKIAQLVGEGEKVASVRQTYKELAEQDNIRLIYNGSEKPPFFPLSKIDHRKMLLIYKDGIPHAGAVFGSSINYHLDTSLGSALYLQDKSLLSWFDQYSETPHYTPPTQVELGNIKITTRELTPKGNELADEAIAEVARHAQSEILFCSQFVPDGKTFREMAKAAKKGVKVLIYSNFPPLNRQPLNAPIRILALQNLARLAKETGNVHFFVPESDLFIHLMALIADPHDSNQAKAITGSDNLTNDLVYKFGMRETLLTINDPRITTSFVRYLEEKLIPKCRELNLYNASLKNILIDSSPYRKGPPRL